MPATAQRCTITSGTSCTDGIKNQNEADIDCGGDCTLCQPEASEGFKPKGVPTPQATPGTKNLFKYSAGTAYAIGATIFVALVMLALLIRKRRKLVGMKPRQKPKNQ